MTANAPAALMTFVLTLGSAIPALAAECPLFVPSDAPADMKAKAKQCQQQKEEARLGTYFCYIEQMVGIQYPSKGDNLDYSVQPFVGKIRPNSDKFFAEIIKNDISWCLTENGKKDELGCDHWGAAPYTFKTESKDVTSYAKSYDTYAFDSVIGKFSLYANYEFKSYNSYGNSYIAQGKCQKIK